MMVKIMEYLFMILKTTIFFLVLIVILRILGKREVGEISVFDLVVLLIIADIATLGIDGKMSETLVVIVSLFTLLLLQKLMSFLTVKFPFVRSLVEYKPSIIIYNGALNMREMKRQSYTIDDLITQVRGNGIMDLGEVKMAILESSGDLSVYKKNNYDRLSLPVVISGHIVKESLEYLHLKEEDVLNYLQKNNFNLKKVHYLSSDGKSYFWLKELKL